MAQRTIQPDKVKSLADWVARWPKATNLGFDAETREATIYDTTKERNKVSSIPWKREADVLTVLGQPTRFSAQAVAAAKSRFRTFRDERDAMRGAGEEGLRAAEATLLDAWRTYHAAPAAGRSALRRPILVAEAALRTLEKDLIPTDAKVVRLGDMTGMYVPPMPAGQRGLPLSEVA
jgi:hypothetical protein